MRLSSSEQIVWFATAALLALLAGSFLFSLFDARTIGSAGVWDKPMKFQISLATHLATMGLVIRLLGDEWRHGAIVYAAVAACVAATTFEILYIMVQAARQQQSHFNLSTPFYHAMYVLMAAGAVVISVAAGVIGIVGWLDKGATISAPVRLAIALGLAGGALLTIIAGFAIGSRLSPLIGEPVQPLRQMPLFGWSLSQGDLRVPHFLATHMMQAVPLAGIVAARILPSALAAAAVAAFAIGWCALTYFTFQQAPAGKPLLTL